MRKTNVLALIILISLALFASGCEEKLSAEEIATKMQEKGESLEDYSCIMYTATYVEGEKVQENGERIMYKKPNMMKSWIIEQGKEEVASVSDGEFLWSYDAGTNTVTKIKLPEKPLINESDYLGLIEDFLNKTNVSLLGVEEVDGRNAYVLEAEPEAEKEGYSLFSRTKMWVDRDTWMPLRNEMYDSKGNLVIETEMSDLELNTGIPDSEFEFEVPEGAEIKVIDLEDFKAPEEMSLEEAREKVSFEILIPEYIPEGYVLNYTMVYDNYETAFEGQGSEAVILNYQREDESFRITQTIYENKLEENIIPAQMAENVSINGKKGKYINQFGDLKILIWDLGEFEMTLTGYLEKAEMLKIAKSLQEPFTESDILDAESLKEPFTEFYILGPEGTAENYPTDYVLGGNGTIIVRIINHEQKPVNYTMEVRLEDMPLPLPDDWKSICIVNNETWEKVVTITPPFVGTNMNLEFLLYNNDKKDMLEENVSVPYRDLHLWINVTTQNFSKNASTPLTVI